MNGFEISERRRHHRQPAVRTCKVRDRRTSAYVAGVTADFSIGGAMVRVQRDRPFGPGDELDLLIAWDGAAVLSSEAAVRARVRRVTPIDHHHQAVAVEFVREGAALAAKAA